MRQVMAQPGEIVFRERLPMSLAMKGENDLGTARFRQDRPCERAEADRRQEIGVEGELPPFVRGDEVGVGDDILGLAGQGDAPP